MRNILFVLSLLLFALGCKNDKNENTAVDRKTSLGNKVEDIPGLPNEVIKKLLDEVTYVDYIFHDLPFSISQDNKASVLANLQLISMEALTSLPDNCKALGREFFHINGEIEYEADLYYGNGCMGYVFMKDEKPIYANKISPSGIKFYGNLIEQASKVSNQVNNGQ